MSRRCYLDWSDGHWSQDLLMAISKKCAVVRKRYAAKGDDLKAFVYKVSRIRFSNPSPDELIR